MAFRRSRRFWLVVVAGVVLAGPGAAVEIQIGGLDSESQYIGFTTGQPGAGVLTFYDDFNGANPNPENGTVTTCEVDGLSICASVGLGALSGVVVELSAQIAGSAPIASASFGPNGPGAELLIWDSSSTNLLLAFQLDFLKVANATWDTGPFGSTEGSITLGTASLTSPSVNMTLAGGSLNAIAGGTGANAKILLQLQSLSQPIDFSQVFFNSSYFDVNFTAGFGNSPVGDTLFEIRIDAPAIPEPSVVVLVATGALGMLALVRRRLLN